MISGEAMMEFLAGAVTLAYLLAAVYFLLFWRRTSDRLFLHFSWAFALLALNQLVVSVFWPMDERSRYAYVLRVLAFVIILLAIVDKNIFGTRKRG